MQRTILMHPPPDGTPTSRYVECLVEALGAVDVQVVGLGLASVVRNPGVVLHIHWPEHFFGHPSPVKSIARLARASAILAVARLRGQPIVWTAHNLEPHGGWPIGAGVAARRLRSTLAGVVVLCDGQQKELLEAFPELERAHMVVLPEGRLHDGPVLPPPDAGQRPVRLLHLGTLIPYKCQAEVLNGLSPLLEAGQVELRIVGRSGGDPYSAEVEALAAGTAGAEFIGRRVSEAELMGHMEWCDAAIGVQRPAFNTGVPAAVVPLGRRVVLSKSTQSSMLRSRVGDEWVLEIDDPTDHREWDSLLGELRTPTERHPPVSLFSWDEIARDHAALYVSLSSR